MGRDASAANLGSVVALRGSVVDVHFAQRLPPIHSVLRAGADSQIVIEVVTQLNARRVRGIALTPTQGLARGMSVEDTGSPLQVPVGKAIISRMFNVFGRAIDRQPEPAEVEWRTIHREPPPLSERSAHSEIFLTGITAIDSSPWSAVARPDYSGVPARKRAGGPRCGIWVRCHPRAP